MSKFAKYWKALDKNERQAFAERAGTSSEYIRAHLYYGRKTPRPQLINNLATASQGQLKLADVLDHFYRAAA